jgi:putative transposase
MAQFPPYIRKPHLRWQNWNYSNSGKYFITTVTRKRVRFFGHIRNKEMILNDMGIIANNCWLELPEHYLGIELGEFVVMPDHFHGIIIIPWLGTGHVRTGHAPSLLTKPTLSNMVGSFKSAVSKSIHDHHPEFGWQERFHDRVIRSKEEFERITNYIRNNPANWKGGSDSYDSKK